MKVITVKDKNEGGKKAFELIKQGIDNGAKVLGWPPAPRRFRCTKKWLPATSTSPT